MVDWIALYRPKTVCFVDYPGLNLHLAKELKKRAESSIQIFLPREWHAPIIEEQDVMKSLEQRNALISAFVQQNLPEIDVSQNVDLVVSAIESQDAMLLQFEY